MVVVMHPVVEQWLGNVPAQWPGAEELLLNRPVKALNVGIVVALSDTGVSQLYLFGA